MDFLLRELSCSHLLACLSFHSLPQWYKVISNIVPVLNVKLKVRSLSLDRHLAPGNMMILSDSHKENQSCCGAHFEFSATYHFC
jgi:hypothetical protein